MTFWFWIAIAFLIGLALGGIIALAWVNVATDNAIGRYFGW